MNRWRQPHPSRAGHRCVASLLAVLLCVAPVASAVHAAEEIHRYCAEHDALEEVPGGAAAAPSDAAGPLAGATDTDPPAHEHCAFDSCLRQVPLLTGPGQSTPTVDPVGEHRRLALDEVPAPVELLRQAPKTSPPG